MHKTLQNMLIFSLVSFFSLNQIFAKENYIAFSPKNIKFIATFGETIEKFKNKEKVLVPIINNQTGDVIEYAIGNFYSIFDLPQECYTELINLSYHSGQLPMPELLNYIPGSPPHELRSNPTECFIIFSKKLVKEEITPEEFMLYKKHPMFNTHLPNKLPENHNYCYWRPKRYVRVTDKAIAQIGKFTIREKRKRIARLE